MEGTATFEPQQQQQLPGTKQPSRIILLVEATAAAAANNKTARKWIDLLLKKIESDARAADSAVSGSGAVAATGQAGQEDLPRTQYALIVYGTWDRSTQAPLQFSSWCSSLTELFEWLNGVQFVGGSPNKGAALTEALAQAIIMSKCPYPDGSRPTAAGRGRGHCHWVAAGTQQGGTCSTLACHWLLSTLADTSTCVPPCPLVPPQAPHTRSPPQPRSRTWPLTRMCGWCAPASAPVACPFPGPVRQTPRQPWQPPSTPPSWSALNQSSSSCACPLASQAATAAAASSPTLIPSSSRCSRPSHQAQQTYGTSPCHCPATACHSAYSAACTSTRHAHPAGSSTGPAWSCSATPTPASACQP